MPAARLYNLFWTGYIEELTASHYVDKKYSFSITNIQHPRTLSSGRRAGEGGWEPGPESSDVMQTPGLAFSSPLTVKQGFSLMC